MPCLSPIHFPSCALLKEPLPPSDESHTIFAQAGGTGLTLTAATHVIHFDRQYNPAIEAQAMRLRLSETMDSWDSRQDPKKTPWL